MALVPVSGAIGSFWLRETMVRAQWMDPQQRGEIGDRVVRQVGFFVVCRGDCGVATGCGRVSSYLVAGAS